MIEEERCDHFGSGSAGQRLHRAFRCHYGGRHEQERAVLGCRRGEVWVWAEAGRTLHLVWQAHSANVFALAFSPDGRILASGSHDGSVKLWEVEGGTLLWTGWHTGGIICVTFAPDGRLLATGGGDTLIRLWDPHGGTNVRTLAGQAGAIHSLA